MSSISKKVVAAEVNLSYMNDEGQQNNNRDVEFADEKTSNNTTTTKWPFCCTRRMRCFLYITLVLLLSIAFITILILYVTKKDDDKYVETLPENNTSKSTDTISMCLDENCITRASEILKSMNDSVDPCEDFFSFACGRWQGETLVPPTQTMTNMFALSLDDVHAMLRGLITSDEIQEKYRKNRAVMKSFQLYQTCLSKTRTDEDVNYLKNIIGELGGSNLTTPSWTAGDYNVFDGAVRAIRDFGIEVLFKLDVYHDFKNATQRRFIIRPGGLTLKNTFYKENNSTDPYYSKTRQSYQEYMVDVMTIFGVDPQEAKTQMEQVFRFEEKMVETTLEVGPPQTSTIGQLSNRTQHDWLTFFRNLTINQSYSLEENERILLLNRIHVEKLTNLINNTDKTVLSNYIAWRVLDSAIDHLPEEYRQAKLTFEKKRHGNNREGKEKWQDCVVFTIEHFPFAIGLIYVDREVTTEMTEKAREILEAIRREFLLDLDSKTWMDDVTRAAARKKAEMMTVVTGYPDFIKDEEKLYALYEHAIILEDQYLKTVFGLKSFTFMGKVRDLRLPADRHSFDFSPVSVNAYYKHQENKITLPAGILRPPFFSVENIRASNYGGVGMIAGHEITHGFDNFGSQFDGLGNRNNWWSETAWKNFLMKRNCLVEQYSNFTFFGKNVNGIATLGENIADNGGIKFAFKAYRRWVEENGEENKLPGLDFTPNQLFFISFAQVGIEIHMLANFQRKQKLPKMSSIRSAKFIIVSLQIQEWCSQYTREGAIEQIDNLQWPPTNIRVKGVLQNMEPFAEAFNCKPGSPMSPRKRCKVW